MRTFFFRLIFAVIIGSILFVVWSIRWYPSEQVLTIWVWGSPQEAQLYQHIIEEYRQQKPEAQIRVEVVPGRSITQKLLTGMDAGHAPDICVLHWREMARVAATGQLLPLNNLVQIDQVDLDDFYDVGIQAYTYHDTLYGLPVKGSTITCFYNMDLFDKYGIAYPTDDWTWDDLLTKAKQLTLDTNKDGLADIYGCTPYDIASYVWSSGGDFLRQENGRYVSNLDDPRVLAGVQFYVDLYFKHKISPPRPGVRSENPMSTFTFEAGRVAIGIMGPWMLPTFQKLDRFRWNTALFPQGSAGRQTRYASVGFTIWKGTKQPALAWDVLKHMVAAQSTAQMAQLGSDLPPQRSVAKQFYSRPDTPWDEEVFVRSMDYPVRLFPQELWWEDLYRKMLDELDAALTGRESVEVALAQAHLVTNRYLDHHYSNQGRE